MEHVIENHHKAVENLWKWSYLAWMQLLVEYWISIWIFSVDYCWDCFMTVALVLSCLVLSCQLIILIVCIFNFTLYFYVRISCLTICVIQWLFALHFVPSAHAGTSWIGQYMLTNTSDSEQRCFCVLREELVSNKEICYSVVSPLLYFI